MPNEGTWLLGFRSKEKDNDTQQQKKNKQQRKNMITKAKRWIDKQESRYRSERNLDISSSSSINEGEEKKRTSDEEEHEYLSHFHDNLYDMTYGRRIARCLSGFKWYNPQLDREGGPSIDKAWSYFEHITLPRHFVDGRKKKKKDDGSKKGMFEKAEQGEREFETRLYSVWKTPETDLADFGVGIGIYFFKLRVLSIIMFIAGLLSIPVIQFYASDEYSQSSQKGLKFILRGTAVCMDKEWEACPTCNQELWDAKPPSTDRYAEYLNHETNETLRFILTNKCDINYKAGFISWIALMFVLISVYFMGRISKKKEVEFDEAAQTTTDYSIEIENPPEDAHDPEEWREFFSQFPGTHVTCCTIALNNEKLIRALATRRNLVLQIQFLLPRDYDFNPYDLDSAVAAAHPQPWYFHLFGLGPFLMGYYDATTARTMIRELDEEIEMLSKKNFGVSEVFVTFETEHGQRLVLEALSVRKWDVLVGYKGGLKKEYLFRGKYLLSVREPPEPSAVRWQDLDESFLKKRIQKTISFLIMTIYITLSFLAIRHVRREYSNTYAAITVTLLNSATPYITPIINNLETHTSEGSRQASLYVKNTAYLWINTAIITSVITPFADTVENGKRAMIPAMYAIFIAELLRFPATKMTDLMGNFLRHFMGPRELDQKRMNYYFRGKNWELAERVTDMTNILFLTFYYSVIFPSGYFFASLTLAVHYWVDKFCLLRTWARAPMLGTHISNFSRNYFFTLALFVYAVVSAYTYTSFPFDSACQSNNTVPSQYIGTFQAHDGNDELKNITITSNHYEYSYCNQNMLREVPLPFPPFPNRQPEGKEWMNEGQTEMARIYGWTCIFVTVVLILIFLNRGVKNTIREFIYKAYEPSGRAMEERFSDVKEIFGYVPQVRMIGHPFPFLACDVTGVDAKLIGWSDPYHSYARHNLMFDLPCLMELKQESMNRLVMEEDGEGSVEVEEEDVGLMQQQEEKEERHVFSVFKHWPPETATRKSKMIFA